MRKNTLAIVISSVLFGATAVAQSEPATSSYPSSETSQVDTARPDATSTAPDADTATGSSSGAIEADQSTSSSTSTSTDTSAYPPASSHGTDAHGSDKSSHGSETSATAKTSGSVNSSDQALSSTHHWTQADIDGDGELTLAEIQAAAPTFAANFQDMDTDANGKLSRDELKAYERANPGRSMEADQGTSSSSWSTSSSSTDTSRSESTSTSTDTPMTDDTSATTDEDAASSTTGQ